MGSWPRYTLYASISFFSTLGSHNFINGSSYHWLLLCLQVFLFPLLRDTNRKFSMNSATFFNLCLLSLFLPTTFLLRCKIPSVSCFHVLYSFSLTHSFYALQYDFHTCYHISWLKLLCPETLLCILIVKFSFCNLKGLYSCGQWKTQQVWTCSSFQRPP